MVLNIKKLTLCWSWNFFLWLLLILCWLCPGFKFVKLTFCWYRLYDQLVIVITLLTGIIIKNIFGWNFIGWNGVLTQNISFQSYFFKKLPGNFKLGLKNLFFYSVRAGFYFKNIHLIAYWNARMILTLNIGPVQLIVSLNIF